jgi:hypothetical protein
MAADIVNEALGGTYDVAILRGVLIVLTPEQARRALGNVSAALAPGGAIYVVGWILDDSRVSPLDMAVYSLMGVTSFERAGLYTQGEIQAWLTEAGFERAELVRSAGAFGADFLRAYKATVPGSSRTPG